MASSDDPGFDPGTERGESPSLEEEIAAARETLAEARAMLEAALKKTEAAFDGAAPNADQEAAL